MQMTRDETVPLSEAQQFALDTILRKPTLGIGIWQINPMEWRMIDRLAGVPEGTYRQDPVPTYRRMLVNSGCCMLDQWIPANPLTIGAQGYGDDRQRTATTGAERIVVDGREIREPEDVAAHLEDIEFPRMRELMRTLDPEALVRGLTTGERSVQAEVGSGILKAPYNMAGFPRVRYAAYGYANYFMAYALYPDLMARDFKLQADCALIRNRAVARAFAEGRLAPYMRLDYDIADDRGTLMDIRSLDRIWFPHFARCLEPLVKAGITMIWHCDGNLMQMVPRLLDCGLKGFQGFQYEHGMDYDKICRMKTRDGEELLIIGGVSVTRTLPFGTPGDVKKEMDWLVRCGPKQGLFLACSSSIAPGVPWENLKTLTEGFHHYRTHGR